MPFPFLHTPHKLSSRMQSIWYQPTHHRLAGHWKTCRTSVLTTNLTGMRSSVTHAIPFPIVVGREQFRYLIITMSRHDNHHALLNCNNTWMKALWVVPVRPTGEDDPLDAFLNVVFRFHGNKSFSYKMHDR